MVKIEEIFPPAKVFKDLASLVNILLPNIILLSGVIFFLVILFAGFQMIQSAGSGDAQASAKWKTTLTHAIIGFGLVVLSYTIITLLEIILGVNIFNAPFLTFPD